MLRFKTSAFTTAVNAERSLWDQPNREISNSGLKIGNNMNSQAIWSQFWVKLHEIN